VFRQVNKDPQQFKDLLNMALELAVPMCWVCLMGCSIEEDMCHRVVDERTRFYCSKECMWLDESNPGRYEGDRNFFDRYHGWEMSEVVQDIGFVRADGKTLLGQPHLDPDGQWTLDDIRSMQFEVKSPNITVAEKMGLPNGSSAGLENNGHVNGGILAGNGRAVPA
jgi:propane monooxygenase large subunit